MDIYVFILTIMIIQNIIILANDNRVKIKISLNKYVDIVKRINIAHCCLAIDFFLLFLLAVFRDEAVGTDYRTYISIFETFLDIDYNQITDDYFAKKGEISFVLLGYVVKQIFSDYIYIVCASYLIILFFVYKFIKKYSLDILVSGFLFFSFSFYNMSLNILREYIAAAIILKSVDYINRDWKRFLLCVLIAMTFHKTAVIFVIIYPALRYIKDARKSCIVLLLLCAIIAMFSNQFISFIGDVANYGSKYTTAGNEAEIDLKIFVNSILFLMYYFYYKQFNNKDENAGKWLVMSAFTLGLNFSAFYFHYINRVFLYFMLPEIVSIPNFINSFNSPRIKLGLKLLLIIMFSAYYLILIYNTTCYDTVPYTSVVIGI